MTFLRRKPRIESEPMYYSSLEQGWVFRDYVSGRTYTKICRAYALDKEGHDRIFGLNDLVVPLFPVRDYHVIDRA
jgi:hypothetical protein